MMPDSIFYCQQKYGVEVTIVLQKSFNGKSMQLPLYGIYGVNTIKYLVSFTILYLQINMD
ncbi:hypothetical protein MTBBW1_970030 [Desulfamplus magnetovallimortis]|uniref:Uncharacterized protein n=1 Tax=Desulfamplus magnetovallimortis TaxID=1246637 RepID=A0A1W1HLA6_9BACT|nr:hypothetical protein MTBBW1_970030 [Desulfamplus magnetovallimortis]